MKYGQIGAAAFVMLLLLLFQAVERTTTVAQEREWEIFGFFKLQLCNSCAGWK